MTDKIVNKAIIVERKFMAQHIEPVKKFPNSPVKQKEYRVSYIDQGIPRKATIFAFNMKPVLSTFFTHFPISTDVTAIQLVTEAS